MSKITLLDDGSLLFSESPSIVLKQYEQDPENPLRFVPKFEPCIYRQNKCKVSLCSKNIKLLWTCSLKNITVSTGICELCDERKQGPETSDKQSS